MRLLWSPGAIVLFSLMVCQSGLAIGGGFWELNISPSARINGIGEAGVAVVDGSSFFYNPGNLGLAARELRFAGRVYPSSVGYMKEFARMDYSHLSAMVGFRPGEVLPVAVGLGYYRTVTSDTFCLNGPLITEKRSNEVAFGLGFEYLVEAGVGMTVAFAEERVRWYRWSDNALLSETQSQACLYDFGFIARKSIALHSGPNGETNLKLTPSVGISWSDIGSDYSEVWYWGMYTETPEHMLRVGGTIALAGLNEGVTAISILGAYQFDRAHDAGYWDNHHRMGLELCFAEALAGRGGLSIAENGDRVYVVGGSLFLSGLVRNGLWIDLDKCRLIFGCIDLRNLDLELSTAYYLRKGEHNMMAGTTFIEMGVTYCH